MCSQGRSWMEAGIVTDIVPALHWETRKYALRARPVHQRLKRECKVSKRRQPGLRVRLEWFLAHFQGQPQHLIQLWFKEANQHLTLTAELGSISHRVHRVLVYRHEILESEVMEAGTKIPESH